MTGRTSHQWGACHEELQLHLHLLLRKGKGEVGEQLLPLLPCSLNADLHAHVTLKRCMLTNMHALYADIGHWLDDQIHHDHHSCL